MEDLKKLKSRIDWICDNKVNAFSPTISPAFKSKDRNEIESILEAVKYYVKNGQTELIFQRKYMGSYCDIYLHKNLDDTYLISRNGHKITHIDLEKAKQALVELHQRFDWDKVQLIIIQSELLPWSVLGKGLIDNDFGGYLTAHEQHYAQMSASSIYQKIADVKASDSFKAYIDDRSVLSAKDLASKYPSHIIRQYNSIDSFLVLNMPTYKKGIDTYKQQYEHFGQVGEMYFKPFNILKKIFEDGTEEFVNDNFSYQEVNDDSYKTLRIDTDLDLLTQVQPIYDWYNQLCDNLDEGIMIKPRTAFIRGIAPAFKVRNNNYLNLIYGVDFIAQYESYLDKRNVRRKIECSINDWMQNWELLNMPYHKINKENYAFKNIVLDRILGEQIENSLDHRL
jgi:hypothetical protein